MTAAVRPQLVGLTMLDDEDKEGDKLGEEEDEELEEHRPQGCGEHRKNATSLESVLQRLLVTL